MDMSYTLKIEQKIELSQKQLIKLIQKLLYKLKLEGQSKPLLKRILRTLNDIYNQNFYIDGNIYNQLRDLNFNKYHYSNIEYDILKKINSITKQLKLNLNYNKIELTHIQIQKFPSFPKIKSFTSITDMIKDIPTEFWNNDICYNYIIQTGRDLEKLINII